MIYVCGPGHGGPGLVANTYLEGTYTEIYPTFGRTKRACSLFKQFSFPAAFRATSRRRRRVRFTKAASWVIRCCTLTARCSTIRICSPAASSATAKPRPDRCATSWHSNKFLNPARDGAVLPILHLNGYKIASPTVLARIPHDGT